MIIEETVNELEERENIYADVVHEKIIEPAIKKIIVEVCKF